MNDMRKFQDTNSGQGLKRQHVFLLFFFGFCDLSPEKHALDTPIPKRTWRPAKDVRSMFKF